MNTIPARGRASIPSEREIEEAQASQLSYSSSETANIL